MNLLVTGGAGYIGSHMVKILLENHHDVIVLDNLSKGHRDAVPDGLLHEGDILDRRTLDGIFGSHRIDAVLHFAGRIEVGESVLDPTLYYKTNIAGTRNLVDAMKNAGVDQMVFSSTAAVYGEPELIPIPEDHPKRPTNPYGVSKWMVELMLQNEATTHGLRSVSLRYFNASGAARDGSLGERHDPETHLIPLACHAASGRRPDLTVFGRDYPTPDGTCIRDFIHVEDLCSAHLQALDYLQNAGDTIALNIGYGHGSSVQEVIDAVTRISGSNIKIQEGSRRHGDPSRLIADPDQAYRVLGWQPTHIKLDSIVNDTWRWERKYASQ